MYEIRRLVFAILIAVIVLMTSSLAVAQQSQEQTGITVTGHAEVKGTPEIAYVTFGVITNGANAAKAVQQNAANTNAVISAIMKSGIPKSDIKTTEYTVYPQTTYPNPPMPGETAKLPVVTYQVNNQVLVKLHDLTTIGSLIDAATAAGANNVQNIVFTVDNQEPLKQQALADAVTNARAKAAAMAKALDVKLGVVRSASESVGYSPRPVEYGIARSEAAQTPIIPGQVSVTADVTLVYSIQYFK